MIRDLKGVIRFRKWQLDEKRQALEALLRNEQGLVDALTTFEEEMTAEIRAATAHAMEGGATFGTYVHAAKARRRRVEQGLAEVRERVKAAREELAESFREFKAFDIAQKNRDTAERHKRQAKAQKNLDEIALTIYRRKG